MLISISKHAYPFLPMLQNKGSNQISIVGKMIRRTSSVSSSTPISRILIIYTGGTIGMIRCPDTKGMLFSFSV